MTANVITPASHSEWLTERAKGIGSSDIATVVGLNPYDTPYSLWRRKLGLDPQRDETLPMRLGHLLEDSVATLYSDETGAKIDADTVVDFICYDDTAPYLRVSPDRFATRPDDTREIVECKTTQMRIDPDDLPEWWFAQVMYQMGVTGIHHATIAWLTQGRDFGYQHIEFVPDFYDFLREEAERFYTLNIQQKQEPKAMNSDDLLAKFGIGVERKTVEADLSTYTICQRLIEVKEQIRSLETAKDEMEEAIKMKLKDATDLTFHGDTLVTWRGAKPSQTFDRKRFEKDYPELAQKYITEKPGTRRFLVK